MGAEYVYITVRAPRSGFHGVIREGWFIPGDESVRLADCDGNPLPGASNTTTLGPGETAREAATRLLKKRSTHGPASTFNRRLRYPRLGKI